MLASRLHPEPVSGLNATDVRDTQLTLFWTPPKAKHYLVMKVMTASVVDFNALILQGDYDSFEIAYMDHTGRKRRNSTSSTSIILGGLRPFRNYTFTVVSVSGSASSSSSRDGAEISAASGPKRSLPVSGTFETRESVPGTLTVFEPFEVMSRNSKPMP